MKAFNGSPSLWITGRIEMPIDLKLRAFRIRPAIAELPSAVRRYLPRDRIAGDPLEKFLSNCVR